MQKLEDGLVEVDLQKWLDPYHDTNFGVSAHTFFLQFTEKWSSLFDRETPSWEKVLAEKELSESYSNSALSLSLLRYFEYETD